MALGPAILEFRTPALNWLFESRIELLATATMVLLLISAALSSMYTEALQKLKAGDNLCKRRSCLWISAQDGAALNGET